MVYLCPTRQLVNQVVEQANDKYGLTVLGFTGRIREYDPTSKAEYRAADHIAVTTYSSAFNTNPFFDDAAVLILDDAHAAEQYIASHWSILIERDNETHAPLHAALCTLLQPHLDQAAFSRLTSDIDSPQVRAWVDKLPTPKVLEIRDNLAAVLDAHAPSIDLRYSWETLGDHLHACHIYISSTAILIRPLVPPTWTHDAFITPSQRIYMSATLGAGGDLERMMGRTPITRLPIPDEWDRQGVGRRFFIFPGMSLKEDESNTLRIDLMRAAGRSLVLVPSGRMSARIGAEVFEKLGFETFNAEHIEVSKAPFITTPTAVAVVANRYDGIDFPGDECRLLFVEGLPKAMNLQERFLMSRMAANLIFNERVQIRVLQAIGRCTRSLEDYSAVVISGEELTDFLSDARKRKFLHPELQSEILFGVDQSKGTTASDILENFEIFLANGEEWESVNQDIIERRASLVQEPFPAMTELASLVRSELEFSKSIWQGDGESALRHAEAVLGGLTSSDLRGYRALWHYLAGSGAWMGWTGGGSSRLRSKARKHFEAAKGAAVGIPWLVGLARFQEDGPSNVERSSDLMIQIERLEATLTELGTVHDRKFVMREKYILERLDSSEARRFEEAQRSLGDLLGFESDNDESEGAPDPWWITGDVCFVFEDHSDGKADTAISVNKARQVASHPAWMRANVVAASSAEVLPILVTRSITVRSAALPHLETVYLWPVEEYLSWARRALECIRRLRSTYLEPGDLAWRSEAADAFKRERLDGASIRDYLASRRAKDVLKSV